MYRFLEDAVSKNAYLKIPALCLHIVEYADQQESASLVSALLRSKIDASVAWILSLTECL